MNKQDKIISDLKLQLVEKEKQVAKLEYEKKLLIAGLEDIKYISSDIIAKMMATNILKPRREE